MLSLVSDRPPVGASLSKTACKSVLRTIFLHLDGLVLGPTIDALRRRGLLEFVVQRGQATNQELSQHFAANPGYLDVAFRLFEHQGWVHRHVTDQEVLYELAEPEWFAKAITELYAEPVSLLMSLGPLGRFESLFFDQGTGLAQFAELVARARSGWGMPACSPVVEERLRCHLDGILIAPAMVALTRHQVFERMATAEGFLDPENDAADSQSLRIALELFQIPGWVDGSEGRYRLTAAGEFAVSRAHAYGITVSYLPTLLQLPWLFFGDLREDRHLVLGGPEAHVDRAVNIWARGLSHRRYFSAVDDVIVRLFDRPLDEQPAGIADLACGDGTFLEHIYDVIRTRTLRGRHLQRMPLTLVGGDFSPVALEATRQTLSAAGIPHRTVRGDISQPEQLTEALSAECGLDADDFLHVRCFIDHDRHPVWPGSSGGSGLLASQGAFAAQGQLLTGTDVAAGLVEHLRRWRLCVGKFGLLLIELHTLPAELTRTRIGQTLATSIDATHGYSDQHPVELPVFLTAASLAGWSVEPCSQQVFPSKELAAVSINYLTPAER